MSWQVLQSARNALADRAEAILGRPIDLPTRIVLSYAAAHMARGRCVVLRAAQFGGIVVEVCAPKPAAPVQSDLNLGGQS